MWVVLWSACALLFAMGYAALEGNVAMTVFLVGLALWIFAMVDYLDKRYPRR